MPMFQGPPTPDGPGPASFPASPPGVRLPSSGPRRAVAPQPPPIPPTTSWCSPRPRFPAQLDRLGITRSRSWRGEQLHRHRGRRTLGVHHVEPRPVRGGGVPDDHRRRPGTPPSRRRSRGYIRAGGGMQASTRRPTPSTTGPGTATWSAPTSRATPHPAGDDRGGGPRPPPPPNTSETPGCARRVVQLQPQPAQRRATCSPRSTRAPTAAAAWARPPDRLVPPLRRRRSWYTGGGHTDSSSPSPLPHPHPRRHPLGRRRRGHSEGTFHR
jgi:hypothetical protein